MMVPLTIIDDNAVEELHSFTVEVVDGPLVTSGLNTTVFIIDNDCKSTYFIDYWHLFGDRVRSLLCGLWMI